MPPAPRKAIVLVDDELAFTELMTLMLSNNLDCPVHGFTRPAEALREIARLDPGVIVTDYFMPQLDGLEFVRQAAVLTPTARFVMITGHSLSSEEENPGNHPALCGFLSKPFGWRKLASEIIRVWPDPSSAPRPQSEARSL
jgi:DNA-binding NtrC family response regulator